MTSMLMMKVVTTVEIQLKSFSQISNSLSFVLKKAYVSGGCGYL